MNCQNKEHGISHDFSTLPLYTGPDAQKYRGLYLSVDDKTGRPISAGDTIDVVEWVMKEHGWKAGYRGGKGWHMEMGLENPGFFRSLLEDFYRITGW